jgi:Tfp pilus assembly protein PilN
VLAATYVVTNKSVTDKTTELATVNQQAEAAEAKAQQLTSYTKFASIRQKRVDTVTQLADSRFDWAHALREVARVLPENAWLTSMSATTSTSVTLAGGAAGTLRSALNVPAIVIQGCTTSQSSVAKLISRLRLVDGVQRVTLEDSTKGQEQPGSTPAAPTTTSAASSGDCRGGHAKFPIFNVDVFFDQGTTIATGTTGATAGATSTTPANTTSSTASSTVPASGTTGGTSK